jgi:hypothetical protein
MTKASLARLRRVRWAVRITLAFGVAASVAANILHANPNPVSQTIAGWPPLALLLTVELVSRVPVHRRSLSVLRVLATGVISGIAAWVSYWHMAGVAARYGETDASPYLLPISVDGLIVVASISLVELAGRIRDAETIPALRTSTVVAQDGAGTVPMIVLDAEDQAVDDELIARAGIVAASHREKTGRDITRDELRAALRVSNATAGELLHRIRNHHSPVPAQPGRAKGNGTIPLIGELTR